MSNQQVGTIYQQIIADVVESSRVDFEEGGVDDHVLEELRLGWQQKLSQLNVAQFPWDPKQEQPPPPPIVNPPTVPSNAANFSINTPPPHLPTQGPPMPQMSHHQMDHQNQGPRIKNEPGLEDGPTPPPFQNPMITLPNATTAQQRAAQHLQNQYGQRASASINAIQNTVGGQTQGPPHQPNLSQMQMQNMQQRIAQGIPQQQQQNPGQPQYRTRDEAELAYRQDMARRTQQQQAQIRNQAQNGGLNGAQTDGAGDEFEEVEGTSVIKRFDAEGNEIVMGRIEIDNLIRRKIEAMGQTMEGGGLMLPLSQATNKSKRQRKIPKKQSAEGAVGGGDANDDDDDDEDKKDVIDEDAINSDLDDPDDALGDDDDDEDSMGHIMLCMYDKVQRVKNKWKCVMKDGVLTVNGKEYVFHKASGEYEW